jgi:hypothetical protein
MGKFGGTAMFDLIHGATRDCEGLTRRDLLRVGSLGLLGLTLPDWLRGQARLARAENGGRFRGEDLNVILMWMQGGPSHIDTFDPKPHAPVEIRGEFKAIPTVLSGVQLCEHLPLLAQNLDKFSIIRSGYSYNASHGVADAYMLSGWKFNASVVYPTYGSVVSKELGYRGGMPPFVQLGTNIDRRFNGGVAGYLGSEYNPFEIAEDPNATAFEIDGISLPRMVTDKRFHRRQTMLEQFNTWQRQVEKSADAVRAMDAFYEKAFGIVTSPQAKRAFDLSREHSKTRDWYGRNRFGQSLLLARRLIEAGVRFVTVTDGGWDTHQNNFRSLKDRKLPVLDRAYAALLADLSARGLLDRTIVVWLGDFGRTPKVNPSAGRDHWAGSTVFCVGGGGIRTGEIVGRSSEFAEQPATDMIRVEDIAATIYTLLGIRLDKEFYTPDGRPMVVHRDGRVLSELLA